MELATPRQLRSAPFVTAGGMFAALVLAFVAQLGDELLPLFIALVAVDALVTGALAGAVVRGASRGFVAFLGGGAGAGCALVAAAVTALARGGPCNAVLVGAAAAGGAGLGALAAILGSVWRERR